MRSSPQENTIGGPVAEYIDTVEVSVVGEVELTINQNLLILPDARLVAIYDRPGKTELGTYNYLIECEGLKYTDYQKITSSVPEFEFRFLGCFDKI